MDWHDLWLMIYAKQKDQQITDAICGLMMEQYGAWDWDAEVPVSALAIAEHMPYAV